MYPRSFDYVAPSSLDEAIRELGNAEMAKVMSGGMSLIPLMIFIAAMLEASRPDAQKRLICTPGTLSS